MQKNNNKTLLCVAILMAVLSSGLRAQQGCDYSGSVADASAAPGGCGGLQIYNASTGEWLSPVNDPGLVAGQSITFSYVPSPGSSMNCPSAIPVEITCFAVISTPNSADAPCVASFLWSTQSGGQPLVSFFPPTVADSDALSYLWDFGDGNTSTEMAPVHQFGQLGIYNVCLTVGGSTCLSASTCYTLPLFGTSPCEASFEFQALDGNVSFNNTTTGSYGGCVWDLGDGTTFLNLPTLDYGYDVLGFFPVCLSVWDANGCLSQVCDEVFTGDEAIICDYSDCVYPGDADGSGSANVYDLLNVGVGYGTTGEPRENSTNEWTPQFADNWLLSTPAGVNFKHIDCNGDGTVNEFDTEAIELNYGAPGSVFNVQADDAPYFWLDFELDTVVVDDNTPAYFEIEADLMAGTPGQPINNLRGFALVMNYPKEMVKLGGVEADYYDNSMLGTSNHILWLSQNRQDVGEFDLGFTKKINHANGYGKIADVTFIVISDVLGRSEEEVTPFTVPLNGAVAVNPAGELLALGSPNGEAATIYIVNQTSTAAKDAWLERQISVFPNPASDELFLELRSVQAERVEVFNPMGQRLLSQELSGQNLHLDTKNWQAGVHLLRVFTNKGVAVKRVVIE